MTIVENGQDLIKVKEALGHGKFMDWLASWFPKSDRVARRWMQIAENYGGKLAVTANLGTEALDALCSASTPDEVRTEVERRAVEGETVSVAEITRLKAEHKAEATKHTLSCNHRRYQGFAHH